MIRFQVWRNVLSWLCRLVLAGLLISAFGALASSIWAGNSLAFDPAVMNALHAWASPWLTGIMRLITYSASALAAIGIALALAFHLGRTERRPQAGFVLATVAGGMAMGQGFKAVLARPRPHLFPWLTYASGWSFPSGHTLNAVILAGLVIWLIGQRWTGWRRAISSASVGLWAILVGVSRIYLGVHYPSDVLASLALGGLCLWLFTLPGTTCQGNTAQSAST